MESEDENVKIKNKSSHYEKVLDYILLFASGVHILTCPYTKVEESFNLQACHDILYHGSDLQNYDHHNFPGVVPRTFLGPLVISGIAYPFVYVLQLLSVSKFYSQYIVRAALGCCVLSGFLSFREAVKERLGCSVSTWLTLITVSQFHFLFYSSRPLPNVFALVLVLHALAAWMRSQSTRFIVLSAAAILIFRVELAIFLGAILLMDMVVGRVPLSHVIFTGVCSLLTWVPLTVCVDSWFWRRTLWPEFEVFHFNVFLNKSSEWGVMPWSWYFYSALPRALASSILLLPLAPFLDRRTLIVLFPSFVFVFLYSFLPHKELRFIIYCLPLLNTAAAAVCQFFWSNRTKSLLGRLMAVAIAGHLLVNAFCSSGLLYVSSLNYPGGEAMDVLHHDQLEGTGGAGTRVHIDVLACQTGVSRFTQLNDNWVYDKTEDMTDEDLLGFSHLIVPGQHKYTMQLKPFLESHEFLAEIEAFSGLKLDYSRFPPVYVETKPVLYVLRRKDWIG